MHSLVLKKATLTDLNALTILEHKNFQTDLMSKKSFRNLLKKNTADIFIAEIENKLIGAAVVFYRKNSQRARLYSLSVDKDFRKLGVAKKLHDYLEKGAKKRSCEEIYLEVRVDNLPAIRFYEKAGYDKFDTRSNFYEDGCDALRMKKAL